MGQGRCVVHWSVEARDTLDEIIDCISADSPETAAGVLNVVLDTAASLSLFASRGRRVPELESEEIREVFIYRYRLIYQVSTAEVRILALVHGAMDFESWLRDE